MVGGCTVECGAALFMAQGRILDTVCVLCN